MKKDDMSFEIEENGQTYKCDILGIIPNSEKSEEPYVIFTDYTLNDKDEIRRRYGRLVQHDDTFYIELKLTNEEMDYIEKNKDQEIIQYVNETIMDALDSE